MAKKIEQKESKDTKDGKGEVRSSGGEGAISFTPGIPARVKEIIGRAGSRGELTQVMCQVLDGRDKNKAIRRNVKGPVQVGDLLMLLETEIEAHRLGGGRRGGRR